MRVLIPLTLATILAACSSEAPVAEPTPDEEIAAVEEAEVEREEAVAASEELTETQAFLDRISQAGAVEIGMAQVETQLGKKDSVKAFAESAIGVHQEMLTSLRDLAETNDLLKVQTVLSDEQKRAFAQLRGARDVDAMYLEKTRASHAAVEKELRDYAENGDFEALRTWSQNALETATSRKEELSGL